MRLLYFFFTLFRKLGNYVMQMIDKDSAYAMNRDEQEALLKKRGVSFTSRDRELTMVRKIIDSNPKEKVQVKELKYYKFDGFPGNWKKVGEGNSTDDYVNIETGKGLSRRE